MSDQSSDKAYFERIGRANKLLPNSGPPASLAEALKSMADLEVRMKNFQRSDIDRDVDLRSHLNFLNHLRTIEPR
jgi:hypothetical protein